MRAALRAVVVLPAALTALAVVAQEPSGGVSARLAAPPGRYTVGDPILLKLTVTHPPGTLFDFPDTSALSGRSGDRPDAPAGILVEEVRPLESNPPLPGETSWSIRIRPFQPGDQTIPSLALGYHIPGSGEPGVVRTEPVAIVIASVLTEKEEKAADIKGPWRIPREWWPIIIGAALALAAMAAALFLWRRYGRRARPAPAAAPPPPVPAESPYDRARREMERLLGSSLLGQGRVKEFHIALSEIVKRFLGEQHRFDALDRTTLEVLIDLSRLGADPDLLARARAFLEACDIVKFAKHQPDRLEITGTIEAARALIETGRPVLAGQPEGVAA